MSKENFFVKQEEEIATENQPIDPEKIEDNLETKEEEERKRNLQNVAAYHFGLMKDIPSKSDEAKEIETFEIERIRKEIEAESPNKEITAEKETANDIEEENERYIFYKDKRETQTRNILTEEETESIKKGRLNKKLIPTKKELGIEDSPEFIETVQKVKKEIIDFAQAIGIDVSMRLNKDADIYLLEKKLYDEYASRDSDSLQFGNEITIRKEIDKDEISRALRHELWHSATKEKIYLKKTHYGIYSEKRGSGLSTGNTYDYMREFDEGITELTNLQIEMESEKTHPNYFSYEDNIIFITGLAEDLAKKLNLQPEKARAIKEDLHIKKEIKQKDIITYFQKGMLEGNMKTLKIISDIYDQRDKNKKTFNALKTLANMNNTWEDTAKIARDFGLEETARKIEENERGEETKIYIANKSIKLNKKNNWEKLSEIGKKIANKFT